MKTIPLGSSGLPTAPFALGTMYFGTFVPRRDAETILDTAMELGAMFLDTANNYAFWVPGGTGNESEETIGRWLSSRPGARNTVTLATKVGARPAPGSNSLESCVGLSTKAIRVQVDGCLQRLQTDHIDLLYAHIDDTSIPLAETIGALEREVERGTVRAIGCSNMSSQRLADVCAIDSAVSYSVLQQRFTYLTPRSDADLSPHVLLDEPVIATAVANGLGMLGYSPLLSGAYTRTDRGLPDAYHHHRTSRQIAALKQTAEISGLDVGQVVLSWMASRPQTVTPVVGVSTPTQLRSAVEALTNQLPDEIVNDLEIARCQ